MSDIHTITSIHSKLDWKRQKYNYGGGGDRTGTGERERLLRVDAYGVARAVLWVLLFFLLVLLLIIIVVVLFVPVRVRAVLQAATPAGRPASGRTGCLRGWRRWSHLTVLILELLHLLVREGELPHLVGQDLHDLRPRARRPGGLLTVLTGFRQVSIS